MGAAIDYFVDPSGGDDITGDGTIGTPWQTVQHALDTITRNTTHGDQINVKAGADDVLSSDLVLTTYGTPAYPAPLIIRGYTTAAEDGGVGVIDLNGANSVAFASTISGCCLVDMEFKGSTDTNGVIVGKWAVVDNCYFHDMTNTALRVYENHYVINSRFENIGTYGVALDGESGDAGTVENCYFENNGSRDMNSCIYSEQYSATIAGNIFNIDGSTNGISIKFFSQIFHNSILSNAGTGAGIICNTTGESLRMHSNLIEGFSGRAGS